MTTKSKFKFDALKWAEKAAAKEDNRPALTWLHADDGALAAADGFRLHVVWGDYRQHADANGFIGVKKSFRDDYSEKDGMKYPDWRAIVSSARDHYRVQFNVGQMLQAVKTARIFSKDSNESTTFVFRRDDDGDACYVIGRSAERGDATSRIRATIEKRPDDQPLMIALNASYVLDALAGFPDEANTTLTTAGYNAPVLIGDTDIEPGSHFAVVMQMSIGSQMEAQPDPTAAADRLAMCDASLPAGSDAPIPWKEQQRKANKRIGKVVAAAGISYMSEYQRRLKDMAKARRERDKYANIEEIDGGARMVADVYHDHQQQYVYSAFASVRAALFGDEPARVGVDVRPGVIRVITLRDTGNPATTGAQILTFTTSDGVTKWRAERVYQDGKRYPINSAGGAELREPLNRAAFAKVLKAFVPDGAEVIVRKPQPAPVRQPVYTSSAAD